MDDQVPIGNQEPVVDLTTPYVLVGQSLRDEVEMAMPVKSALWCQLFHFGVRRINPRRWRGVPAS